MSDVRRFLRYDVSIPIYIREVEESELDLTRFRSEIISNEEDEFLKNLDAELQHTLKNNKQLIADVNDVVFTIDSQLEFMSYLLSLLIERKDPCQQNEFNYKLREFKKRKISHTLDGSKVGALVAGAEFQIQKHVAELLNTIENSIEGKVFLYDWKIKTFFDDRKHVKNLPELVEKGVVIAVLFDLLFQKLNFWEKIYFRLKEKNENISNPEKWQVSRINLSVGGVGLFSPIRFRKFSRVDLFMKVGRDVLVVRAKTLMCVLVAEDKYRIAVEFDFLTVEKATVITGYLQKQELLEAMMAVKLDLG